MKTNHYILVLMTLFCLSFIQVRAEEGKVNKEKQEEQGSQETQAEELEKTDSVTTAGKLKMIPFPVIATNPTVGFAFGFAPGLIWRMGPESTTRMSSAQGAVIYTTFDQFFSYMRGTAFTEGDRWSFMADVRFQIASQPTYGLGTHSDPQNLIVNDTNGLPEREYLRESQMMKYHMVRAYFTALKRHENTPFYYGVGYHLDAFYNFDDKMLNLDTTPLQKTQFYRYNEIKGFSNQRSVLSGLSLNLLYDSRDNVVNPYDGRYAFLTYRMNPMFLGSDVNVSTLWAEYRDYFRLSEARPRHLLAWWSYAWFVTTGSAPYMTLPATGWDMFSRSGRAYTAGRFRGEDLMYTELEYRFPLQAHSDLLGGVVFVNAATASSRTESINMFDHVNLAYGVGLRIMLNKKGRNNVCIDYGRGLNGASGLFVQLNETF